MADSFHIGTCSWKYDSWRGLVYSDTVTPDYLQEYAQRYDTVEVDQWFWSLYGPDKVVVKQHAASVPNSFRFGIKTRPRSAGTVGRRGPGDGAHRAAQHGCR